ncbi:MAG: hypothetical protein NTX00_02090 [Candidatus Parcubacteria bacterium]|nr:hypothetical protein [Candidatus Parcubacteria bacterium]
MLKKGKANGMCVEAEEGVPLGSEAGGPRPHGVREDWPIILLLFFVPVLMVFIIIIGIIGS